MLIEISCVLLWQELEIAVKSMCSYVRACRA